MMARPGTESGEFMRYRLFAASCGVAMLLSLAYSPRAGAQAQGYSFKGNRLGMTLDDFKRQNFSGYEYYTREGSVVKAGTKNAIQVAKPICSDSEFYTGSSALAAKLDPEEIVCPDENPEFAGLEYSILRYRFYKGLLYEVEALFNSSGYDKVKNSFVAKYGPAGATSQQDFKNAAGAQWKGEVLTWRQGPQSIVLTEGPDNGPGQSNSKFRTNASAVIKDEDRAPHAKAPKVDF
jgi:hypothetical protein